MKIKKQYLLAVAAALIVTVITIPLYMAKQQTTFQSEVLDHMSMLDTLDRLIVRKFSSKDPYVGDDDITLQDPNEIRDMLKLLKDVELTKVQNIDVDQQNPDYYEWRLYVNKEGRFTEGFGITFYSDRFITIYSEHNKLNTIQDYEITNDLNLKEIERRMQELEKEEQ